ncbi:hypothetical protein AAG747_15750 [Rapidithrix thailandica]|uniref:MORN repeat-containing protein n=1 Tax=Rapidithrix thailandica TaxID=413964 RepID=A0AAW9SDD8_9BACT
MKFRIQLFGLCMFLFACSAVKAQNSCKVLLEPIAQRYEGECKKQLAHGKGKATGVDVYEGEFKKGLPHGAGVYTWNNGNIFEGEWKKGEKDGEGKLVFKLKNASDSVLVGYWSGDEYIGKNKYPYQVHYKPSKVTSVQFSRKSGEKEEIRVYLNKKNTMVSRPSVELEDISGYHGQVISFSTYAKVQGVKFPYRGYLKFQGQRVEFEISQPGIWDVTVNFVE